MFVSLYLCVFGYVCVSVCVCVYLRVYLFLCVPLFVSLCAWMCVSICVWVCRLCSRRRRSQPCTWVQQRFHQHFFKCVGQRMSSGIFIGLWRHIVNLFQLVLLCMYEHRRQTQNEHHKFMNSVSQPS